jgi:hypothetical protein
VDDGEEGGESEEELKPDEAVGHDAASRMRSSAESLVVWGAAPGMRPRAIE